MLISKSDYLRFRECAKDAWMKIHRGELYQQLNQISAFNQMLFDAGNEVDVLARKLFPMGVMIEGRDEADHQITLEHINNLTPVLFQPVFIKDGFSAVLDILEYNPATDSYTIYEVKSSTKVKPKHLDDITFQVNLLRLCGLNVDRAIIMHLNKQYKRAGELNTWDLFHREDVTEKVEKYSEAIKADMQNAFNFLSQTELPAGNCDCIYKGRSKHCVTFSIHNPTIPAYGVHDISHIGNSKRKLMDLVDSGILDLSDIPPALGLNKNQQNQIDSYNLNKVISDKLAISEQLDSLEFPLYFIDYETMPAAVPRHDGFIPHQQIPFQYALYVLESATSKPQLLEFLHTDNSNPCQAFVESMKKHLGKKGSIIVWFELFEASRNNELAVLFPDHHEFIQSINKRIYDLRKIFLDQHFVHKDFLGKTSIKNVLPVLVPELSYKELDIRDGGMASSSWNKLVSENLTAEEKATIIQDLKKYCGLDAYAMYAIWRELHKFLINQESNIPIDVSGEVAIS